MLRKTFPRFIDAVKTGNVKTVVKLWQQDWTEKEDNEGRRPIHFACENGRADVVKLLVEKGCQIEAADGNGRRPIHLACASGHADVVEFLLDKGCEKEATDKDGCRPIHFASGEGYIDVLTILLNRNCDIEAADEDGLRPIQLACNEGHADIVNLLVSKGCEIDAQVKDGQMTMTFANDECAEIFNKAQEERKKDEFQIFHLPTFSIISRKYKIWDFENSMERIKMNISCINRPVVVCHLMDPLRRILPSQKAFRMVNVGLQYAEYFVDGSWQTNDWQCRMAELRDWDVRVAVNASDSEINLEINRPTEKSKWSRYATVSFDVYNEQSQLVIDTVNMLVMENARGADIKTAFVDFQKFACCREMFEKMEENEAPNYEVIGWLNRWVTTRKEMLMFYDANRQKLTDSDPVILSSTKSVRCRISVVQKVPKQMKFIPTLSKLHLTKDCMAKILSEEYILIRCVTDDQPDWIVPRSDCKTVEHVENRLRPLIFDGNKEGRLMLVGANGQLSSETELDQLGSVIHYAVVLPCENINKMEYIGRGAFGMIAKCQIGNEKTIYAMKEMKIFEQESEYQRKSKINEVMVAARIEFHSNVMKYLRFLEDNLAFYVVMEYMEESLYSYVRKKHPLEEATIIDFARQILEALKHLHDRKVIHRSIKCESVMLDENCCVKLSGFGISKCQNVNTSEARMLGGGTRVGTPGYMAPELLVFDRPAQYGQSSDIWGFGLLMVQMITGKRPYPGLSDLHAQRRIAKDKKVEYEFPSMYSTELKEFVDSCLVYDPVDRPTCAKLLQNIIFAWQVDKSPKLKVTSKSIPSRSTENVWHENSVAQKAPKQNVSPQIVIRCITDEKEPWPMQRKDYETVADVKKRLSELVPLDDKTGRLILIDSNGDRSDDIKIDELDEHVYYDVVWKYENVRKIANIAQGSFGLVSKCEIGNEKTVYAMKEIAKIENESKDSINTAMKEVSVAARIGSNPNLVKYRRFFEDNLAFYIVMDYMEDSLYSYVRKNFPLDEATIIDFARQILEGLKHLHDHKVIHRDVKWKNVLVNENGCVKLCDFGVSKCQNVGTSKAEKEGGSTQIGTERYMAPEVISFHRPDQYGQISDIWGFGLLLVEVITGKEFFFGLSDMQVRVQIEKDRKVEYEFPQMYSKELKEFVDSCLVYDAANRPACAKLLQNVIFAGKTDK